jgi:hypothetical protein
MEYSNHRVVDDITFLPDIANMRDLVQLIAMLSAARTD